jgi:hypothetical protein
MSAWFSPSVFGDVVGLSVGVGRIIAFRDIRSFEIDLLLVLNQRWSTSYGCCVGEPSILRLAAVVTCV